MTGSIIIEQIFGLPGIGRYFVVGALQRDYTLVSGVLILYASLLILLILITDIVRAILDQGSKYKIMNKKHIKIVEDYSNIKGRSLWVDARRRLFQNKAAVVSLFLIFLIAFLSFFGPFFLKYSLVTLIGIQYITPLVLIMVIFLVLMVMEGIYW